MKTVAGILFIAAAIPVWSWSQAPEDGALPPSCAEETAGGATAANVAGGRLYYASRPAAGTLFMIRCWSDESEEEVARKVQRAFGIAKRWEMILSDRDVRSELSQLNDAPCGVAVAIGPELEAALRLSLAMARRTNGSFDPTLGPLVRLWRRTRATGRSPRAPEWERARAASGWRKLAVTRGFATKTVPGMRIDLGGIGKGIMLDRMAESLREQGLSRYLLSDTSDFLAGDPPPGQRAWICRAGGRDAELYREALSTSGGRFQHVCIEGRESTHIIDPATGRGRPCAAAAIIRAATAAEADALATAAYATNREEEKKKIEKKDLHPAEK